MLGLGVTEVRRDRVRVAGAPPLVDRHRPDRCGVAYTVLVVEGTSGMTSGDCGGLGVSEVNHKR